ncbi:MAG TPA: outer membrane beta-barrel protein [Steroidobacteraceae bacterium]|nr:outer membrane beta-barrel protein [Steroidobacteraceae bacterium]
MPLDTPFRAAAIALLAEVAVACTTMCPRLARAAAPGYQIQVGVIESDNIERLPTGGTNQTIGIEELGLTWHEDRPWLDVGIDGDLSHLNYFQHAYSDEYIGNFLGQLKLNLVPELLSWNVNDNFGQAPIEPLAPITPANRESINYFSTGPALILPVGRATYLDITGAYGRVNFQVSPLDSTRLLGTVGLLHELSPATSVSINASDDSIRFANVQENPDYRRQDAFGRFDAKGGRTELGVDLGYSRLLMPGGVHYDTPLVRLDLSRHVSPDSIIGVAFGHDYSDAADAFQIVQAVGGATLNTQPVVAAAAPFVDNYATLAWNFKYLRTTLDLTVEYYRDRYPTDATLNNERTVLGALAARQLTPVVQLALTEYLVRWQFDSTNDSATESDTGLQLTWRAGRNLSVFVSYYLAKGNSNVAAFQYTENRVWLSIGYGRAAEAPPGPAPLKLPGRE